MSSDATSPELTADPDPDELTDADPNIPRPTVLMVYLPRPMVSMRVDDKPADVVEVEVFLGCDFATHGDPERPGLAVIDVAANETCAYFPSGAWHHVKLVDAAGRPTGEASADGR